MKGNEGELIILILIISIIELAKNGSSSESPELTFLHFGGQILMN